VSTKICRPSEAWCGSDRQQLGNSADKGLLSGASAVLPFLADGNRLTPADRLDRASRAAGVEVFYSGGSGRIRPATTRC
jgi:hypothetical protein